MAITWVTAKRLATKGNSPLCSETITLTVVLRVFKYAHKGYRIRILPSYLAHLALQTHESIKAIACGEDLREPPLSLTALANEAREWTKACLDKYIELDHGNRPFHYPRPKPVVQSDKPVFSHAMLESYHQITSEPLWRSCLTGFSLLMRHVALWEQEVAGKIVYVLVLVHVMRLQANA
jgi:hypothetical protein